MFTLRQIRAVWPTANVAVPFVQGENGPYGRTYKSFVIEISTEEHDDVRSALVISASTRRAKEVCMSDHLTTIQTLGRYIARIVNDRDHYRSVSASLVEIGKHGNRNIHNAEWLASATGGDCTSASFASVLAPLKHFGEEIVQEVPTSLMDLAVQIHIALSQRRDDPRMHAVHDAYLGPTLIAPIVRDMISEHERATARVTQEERDTAHSAVIVAEHYYERQEEERQEALVRLGVRP